MRRRPGAALGYPPTTAGASNPRGTPESASCRWEWGAASIRLIQGTIVPPPCSCSAGNLTARSGKVRVSDEEGSGVAEEGEAESLQAWPYVEDGRTPRQCCLWGCPASSPGREAKKSFKRRSLNYVWQLPGRALQRPTTRRRQWVPARERGTLSRGHRPHRQIIPASGAAAPQRSILLCPAIPGLLDQLRQGARGDGYVGRSMVPGAGYWSRSHQHTEQAGHDLWMLSVIQFPAIPYTTMCRASLALYHHQSNVPPCRTTPSWGHKISSSSLKRQAHVPGVEYHWMEPSRRPSSRDRVLA
jgi:hypothetical protein